MKQIELHLKAFSENQRKILGLSKISLDVLTEIEIFKIASGEIKPASLTDEQLIKFLEIANATYRAGDQVISDDDYDHLFLAELSRRNPEHPYLKTVEPESAFEGKTSELPVEMLSTEKAYNKEDVLKWLARIKKAGAETGYEPEKIMIRGTPKLDGFAAYDDGQHLYTRGDGRKGTDITRVFERGLSVGGGCQRGLGAGEIVVSKTYFSKYLADVFDNARNFQASIIKEKELNPLVEEAIAEKEAVFFPFSCLPSWVMNSEEFPNRFDETVNEIIASVDYDVDGAVFETTNEAIKTYLGSTRNHHRWQIAYKKNAEKAETRIINVLPQTSRTGRVNPVAELEPVRLSGALIQRATAHHYGMVKSLKIGPGAEIELVRSGMVIPKIERVIKPGKPQVPTRCPSCSERLIEEKDFLICPNKTSCPAQIENTILHFFKTIKNADGFGSKTIAKLFENGVRSIQQVYSLDSDTLESFGFGEKTSRNLIDQLERGRLESLEDWRFLAALGVYRLGPGMCERLLQYYKLEDVFKLDAEKLRKHVDGFEKITAEAAVKGLQKVRGLFHDLYSLGFNLQRTPLITEGAKSAKDSPISGKKLVFSGAMESGSREDIKRKARALGASIGSSVTRKTDYLVVGKNVGTAKVNEAERKGVQIITEKQYLDMIGE